MGADAASGINVTIRGGSRYKCITEEQGLLKLPLGLVGRRS